ncbi:hypothetical protein ABK040_003106 [Willaertia magna]
MSFNFGGTTNKSSGGFSFDNKPTTTVTTTTSGFTFGTTFTTNSTNKRKQSFAELHSETKKTVDTLNQFYKQLDTVLNEKEKCLNQMTESMKKYDFKDGSIIKLNIGGKLFNVLKETLCTKIKKSKKEDSKENDEYYPEHMLSAMISGLFELLKDENENIFIDRDGTYFIYILNYLRAEGIKGKYSLPSINDECALRCLYIEAQYYQIEGLIEELELIMPSLKIMSEVDKYFPNTNILDYKQIFQLNAWIGNCKQEWNLLWQGTRDGFNANIFHTNCDNKGPTITIVKTTCGSIFGGYTSVNWTSNTSYFSDSNAFLFSLHLIGRNNNTPFKFPISSTSNAIYCNSSYGPAFGSGHDLLVLTTDRIIKSSPSSYSFSNNLLLNGNYFFSANVIEEIEVFCKK